MSEVHHTTTEVSRQRQTSSPNHPTARRPHGRTSGTRDLQARRRKRDIHRHRPSRPITAITYRRIMSGPADRLAHRITSPGETTTALLPLQRTSDFIKATRNTCYNRLTVLLENNDRDLASAPSISDEFPLPPI